MLSMSFRRQLVAAFAVMSAIPLLTLVYLLIEYSYAKGSVPPRVMMIVGLDILLSLCGLLLLGRIMQGVILLQKHLEQPATGDLSDALSGSSVEISAIADSAAAMGRELDLERKWLKDMSVALDQMARERKADRRREAQLMSAVIDGCPSATIVLDATARILSANGPAADVLGLTVEQLTSRALNSTEFALRDRDGEEIHDRDLPFALAHDKGSPVHGARFQVRRPDGEWVTVLADALPVFDESADFYGVVMMIEDAGRGR